MAQGFVFRKTIRNYELNEVKELTASDPWVLEEKVRAQEKKWNEKLKKRRAVEKKAEERAQHERDIEEAIAKAEEGTREAEAAQATLDSILAASIGQPEKRLFENKQHTGYPVPKPTYPEMVEMPPEPSYLEARYHPKLGFIASHMKKKKEQAAAESRAQFKRDYDQWKKQCAEITQANNSAIQAYNQGIAKWRSDEAVYRREQLEHNNRVDTERERFDAGDSVVVALKVEQSINAIQLPFKHDFEAEAAYSPESNSIVGDVYLPTIDALPRLKSVSYVKSREEFKPSFHSDSYMKQKYESVLYQIVLRVVKCVFAIGTEKRRINSLVLNGRVKTVDKTTGNPIAPFVLSLSVSREEFESLNLYAIDPKAWFKKSHGVSAASMADVTPVAPIAVINRDDKRFVESYAVGQNLDEGYNLAAMDWQDFENLVRELFEQEFGSNGGEVRITQASRDGGVDAVAFDPDPIRGGKIVIQAKRYTNTVGVSAVRDLYGTVINEGAMKGILITTANYGNDAYEFARDKPITLMNGANLLALLEKHGHAARINLAEAREQLKKEGSQ